MNHVRIPLGTANINAYFQETDLPECFAVETSDFVVASFLIWRDYTTDENVYLYSNNEVVQASLVIRDLT